MIHGINLTYTQLITTFPPRPITSTKEYWAVQDRIDALLDKHDLTADERDYLTVLGMLVQRYEDDNEPDITLYGIDLIRALMDEQGLSQRDMTPIFKTDSIVSAVLNRKRRLTVEHIDKLADYFDLPHELFFEPSSNQTIHDESLDINQPVGERERKPKYDPFIRFIDSLDIKKWKEDATKITLEQFHLNNRRLGVKEKK